MSVADTLVVSHSVKKFAKFEGFLQKKSPKSVFGKHPWQKRWFVLEDNRIVYFKKQPRTTGDIAEDKLTLGFIPAEVIIDVELHVQNKSRFDIVMLGTLRRFQLLADSEFLCNSWRDSILKGITQRSAAKAGGPLPQGLAQKPDTKWWKAKHYAAHKQRRLAILPASADPNASQSSGDEALRNPLEKTPEALKMLTDTLNQSVAFRSASNEDRQQVARMMWRTSISSGTMIIKRGFASNKYFVIEEGTVAVCQFNSDMQQEVVVQEVGPGFGFGDMMLLYSSRSSVTYRALTFCTLFCLDRMMFKTAISQAASPAKDSSFEHFLRSTSHLSDQLTDEQVVKVAAALECKYFSDGQRIVNPGEDGDAFYILKSGIAIAEIDGVQVAYYSTPGDYFGERSLLANEPANALYVTAQGETCVLLLRKTDFLDLLVEPDEEDDSFDSSALEFSESAQTAASHDARTTPTVSETNAPGSPMSKTKRNERSLSTGFDSQQLESILFASGASQSMKLRTSISAGSFSGSIGGRPPSSPSKFVIPPPPAAVASKSSLAAAAVHTSPTQQALAAQVVTVQPQLQAPAKQQQAPTLPQPPAHPHLPAPTQQPISLKPTPPTYKFHPPPQATTLASTAKADKPPLEVVVIPELIIPEIAPQVAPSEQLTPGPFVFIPNDPVQVLFPTPQPTPSAPTHPTPQPITSYPDPQPVPSNSTPPVPQVFLPPVESKPTRIRIKSERQLTTIGTLGKGTFGHVKLTEDAAGNTYALKVISKAHIVRYSQQVHIISEKHVMEQLTDHPFIVKLWDTFRDESFIYLLLEPSLGGELFSALREQVRFNESVARFYAAGVVLCFEYMHDRNIIYRDLKPENLLLDDLGYLKITDFGFAKVLPAAEKTFTFCGTPDYLAPEMVSKAGHTRAVDWWTLGVLIFEMIAGFPPFYDEDNCSNERVYQRILSGGIVYPPHFSAEACSLIGGLLQNKAHKRLGILPGGSKLIQEHPWFAGFDWGRFIRKEIQAPYVRKVQHKHDLSNFDSYPDEPDNFGVYDPRNCPDPTWDNVFA
jgi:CRP-like cAMP-binding protein